MLRVARWKYSTQKIAKKSPSGHHPTTSSGYIFAAEACVDNRKKLLSSNISSSCSHNMVNLGPLAAEICCRVWGTHANFNGFRVLAALLYGIPVLGVSQTLRRWREGATYIRQGGHHVGHWPTFYLVSFCYANYDINCWPRLYIFNIGQCNHDNKHSCNVKYTVSQKSSRLWTHCNFLKYQSIFKILALLDNIWNFKQSFATSLTSP